MPYDTYTYRYDGTAVKTPDAYYPETVYTGERLGIGALNNPNDLYVDAQRNIYIADTGNNRIVVCDPDFNVTKVIDKFENNGASEVFQKPMGLSVNAEGNLLIADSGSGRIIILDKNGKALHLFGKPETAYLAGADYIPTAVDTDRFGRIFVVAQNINQGIIMLDENGSFAGFCGAQRVSYNPVDYLWKRFMTSEQRARMVDFVPTEYTGLSIDDKGFVYAVSSFVNAADIVNVIKGRIKDGSVSPIKKINFSGYDVLNRNGYFAPVGDIAYSIDEKGNPVVSSITDVALGSYGTYCVLDHARNRIFCYSEEGDLLFAFGAKSTQLGNSENPIAIDFSGNNLLLLDSSSGKVTKFSQTDYGVKIQKALECYYSYRYNESIDIWKDILNDNPNFDLAYDGMGRASMESGKYKDALKYFSYSMNDEMYSKALKEYRDGIANRYIFLIFGLLILLVIVLMFFFKYINRKNKDDSVKKRSLSDKIIYAFYVSGHPFKGFWGIKREDRGSFIAAAVILLLTFIVTVLQKIMTSRLFNADYYTGVNYLNELVGTVGLVLLFVLANWCFTSLMDGEGKLGEIFVNVCYALLPLLLTRFICIPLSYVLVKEEAAYISLLTGIGMVWTVALILAGVTVVHQYSLKRSVVTCLLTVVGMAIIVFIILLFGTTASKMLEFFGTLIKEAAK